MAKRVDCNVGTPYGVTDLTYETTGKDIVEVYYDTSQKIKNIDVIDFQVIDLPDGATWVVAPEKAVALTSSTELFNVRAWVNTNTFRTAMEIKGRTVDALTGTEEAAVDTFTDVGLKALKGTEFDPANYNFPGTFQDSIKSVTCGQIVPTFSGDQTNIFILQVGINNKFYNPKTPYNPSKELNTDGYGIPLGHFCVYGETSPYKKNFQQPQGFAELFAQLPSWEVNIVFSNGIEKTLGKIENGLSIETNVTTETNMSGYPNQIQQIIATEQSYSISATLSDVDPAVYALVNDFDVDAIYNSTTENASTLEAAAIKLGKTTTNIRSVGVNLRSWYQGKTLCEWSWDNAKLYADGNIEGHHTATRLPFRIQPITIGKKHISLAEGILIKKPMIVRTIVPNSTESAEYVSGTASGTTSTNTIDVIMDIPILDTYTDVAGWTVSIAGSGEPIAAIAVDAVDGRLVTITTTTAITPGDAVTLTYDSSTGIMTDSCDNAVDSFTAVSVTNAVTA